uniref:Metalloendopeptidase n=1 Tax=Panagrellus redivivus TaxID=6233 RepID=A0A7E4UTF5_PANRE
MVKRGCLLLLGACLVAAQFEAPELQDAAQVQVLLDEIKIEGIRKFGAFSDYNPSKARELLQTVSFDDGTEASVNRKVLDYLFENDIVLTVPQAHTILQDLKDQNATERQPRQAQPGERYYWKDRRVAYTLKVQDDAWQSLIRRALNHLEDQTCMRFYEDADDKDRLEYTRAGGCWSNVGRIGGRQTVSIGYGCEALGIVAHETLHALGLWHEQSRYDRDDYVNIDFGFIFPGTQSNFAKRTPKNSENYDQRYDLGSVMHYGSKAFSTDYGTNTIITKDSNYQRTIGQRQSISFKDARMINLRYCDDICTTKLDCKNGGYTDPNDCSVCRCPTGLGGRTCEDVASSDQTECRGGDYLAQSSWQSLQSPPVTRGLNCNYRINAPAGEAVEIEVQELSFPCVDSCSSFVEIKYLTDKTTTGAHLCCELPAATIITEDNFAVLRLRGDPDGSQGYLGFTLRYRTVPKSETPRPIPTTTTTTTQATTTIGVGSPHWSDWGAWSTCTVACGGCGERTRVRACYGGNGQCSGKNEDSQLCGQEACPKPQTKRTTRCTGRLVLPCDLLDQLDFGTTHSADAVAHLLSTQKNANTLKRVRREASNRARRFVNGNLQMADGNFCEKRFSYNCPTSLLTINIDRKTNSDVVQDNQECCPGYYRSQGVCIQGKSLRTIG